MSSNRRISNAAVCIVVLVASVMQANSQQVFSNGIDLANSSVQNIGLVENAGASTNHSVVGQAVSIAQLAGGNPENGQMITNATDLLQFVGSSLVIVDTNGNDTVTISGYGVSANAIGAGYISVGQLQFFDGTNYIGSIEPSNGMLSVSGGLSAAAEDLMIDGESLGSIISNLQQKVDSDYEVGTKVVVESVDADAVSNGVNLLAAYAAAKNLNPSSSNHVAVVLPPGQYDLGSNALSLDTEFIDLIGRVECQLTKQVSESKTLLGRTYVYEQTAANGMMPAVEITGTQSITQTANNVSIRNIRFDNQYSPSSGLSETLVQNVYFSGGMQSGVSYAGTYMGCISGNNSFGYNGAASGTFIRCVTGANSFGYYADATGTFKDCTAGDYSYGRYADATGVFEGCVSGNGSFGFDGIASGKFHNCAGGNGLFGYNGEASGTFFNCMGGAFCFGRVGKSNGKYVNCVASAYSFDSDMAGGEFINCVSTHHSFGGYTQSSLEGAVVVNCTAQSASFGSFYMGATNFNYNASGHYFYGGPIRGDGSGLTNLNVALAIPDGSISGDKLDTAYLTSEAYTNGTIPFLSIGGHLPFGDLPQYVGVNSMAVGILNTVSNSSFAAGAGNIATGTDSFAAGGNVKALGDYSHAEGDSTEAFGDWSHAEGWYSKAIGNLTHVEGWNNVATGQYSHVEGAYNATTESAWGAHVEGYMSEAKGKISHAAGWKAKADHDYSFVWSSGDGTDSFKYASTTNRQYSVFADNGIRLITGSNATVEVSGTLSAGAVSGDGSSLTGITGTQVDLSNIGVYGDISMGSFTNSTASN